MICKLKHIKTFIAFACLLLIHSITNAATYIVNTKTNLQNRMNAAMPGDTVIVSNGVYNNWGTITFNNSNGTNTSNWIVLKAETFAGVVFTGNVTLQFGGRRILISGFKFANGNSGATDVIQFKSSSGTSANYCRLSNIIIDNFNSDSTGGVNGTTPDIDNKWISIYGVRNRVDHCTFINKFNAGATVVVWYNNSNYPQASTSTYHTIDSNYFNGRGYMGANGGESIRVGTSSTSRTNGYNVIAYNLFENCEQDEPEIISNKSNFNTYCYNTFKNCNGGLTLRHGRYCSVYGNFFIVNNSNYTRSYGVRVIDKGHRVFNNYFEGLLGNRNSNSSLRCPIILYNGLSSTNDTTDPAKAAGYFPADSTIVAFNSVVNCSGGAGLVLGFTDGGNNTFQPLGIRVANNLIKMTTGQAALIPAANTLLTYTAEGNFYNAPSFGLSSSTGFSSKTLNFTTRINGILNPPNVVQDAATNTSNYTSLLGNSDVTGQIRTAIYDVGAKELNATGTVNATPLDSNQVGAGKPSIPLPVKIIRFIATAKNNSIDINWNVESEINFKQYDVELSNNDIDFAKLSTVLATNKKSYIYNFISSSNKNFIRLKLIDIDGSYTYSKTIEVVLNIEKNNLKIFPNPANNFIQIIGLNNKNSIAKIYNSYGVLVKESFLVNSFNTINTSTLLNGYHTLNVIENNQIISTQKILIQKK